jgi:hypothetical protein
MSYNLTTSKAIIFKAGAGVNSNAAASDAIVSKFCDLAEGQFCLLTRTNWTDATVSAAIIAGFRDSISDAVSDLAAMKLIAYDTSGYTTSFEAQYMGDLLRDNMLRIVQTLENDKGREVARTGT